MLGFDPLSVAPLASLDLDEVTTTSEISLDSVSPSVVPNLGGETLRISGSFISGAVGSVELIGPVDAPTAHLCYAARRGQSYAPIPRNEGVMLVSTPTLPLGSYDVRVVQGISEATLPHAIDIVPRTWEQRTFDLRALYAPLTAVGPRRLERNALILPTGALAIATVADTPGTVATLFALPVVFTNTLPYHVTWSVIGTLPSGLSCDAVMGTIGGLPTTPGTFAGIQLLASWALGSVASNTFTITIT